MQLFSECRFQSRALAFTLGLFVAAGWASAQNLPYSGGPSYTWPPRFYMNEEASRTSYANSSGALVSAVKHVGRIYTDASYVVYPVTPAGGPHLTYENYVSAGGSESLSSFSPGHTTCPGYATIDIFVVANTSGGALGEMGRFSNTSSTPQVASVPLSATAGDTAPGLVLTMGSGELVPIHLAAGTNGVLGSGQVTVVSRLTEVHYLLSGKSEVGHWYPSEPDPNRYWVHDYWGLGWQTVTTVSYRKTVLDLSKNLCTADVSVDSRKAYGQPNLGGELPGDPNAPQRPVNFGAWQYKGGLFLGNAPYTSTGDLSGTARIQLKTNVTGSGTYLGATLAMLPLGVVNRSGFMTSFGIGVYMPSSSDPNLSFAESGVTWDTKWNIQPGMDSQPIGDWTRKAFLIQGVSTSTSTTTPLNFQIGNSQYLSYLSDPAAAFGNLCLALVDENKIVNGYSPYTSQTPCWIYFASKEYPGANTAIPGGDTAPRIWRLGLVSASTW